MMLLLVGELLRAEIVLLNVDSRCLCTMLLVLEDVLARIFLAPTLSLLLVNSYTIAAILCVVLRPRGENVANFIVNSTYDKSVAHIQFEKERSKHLSCWKGAKTKALVTYPFVCSNCSSGSVTLSFGVFADAAGNGVGASGWLREFPHLHSHC